MSPIMPDTILKTLLFMKISKMIELKGCELVSINFKTLTIVVNRGCDCLDEINTELPKILEEIYDFIGR